MADTFASYAAKLDRVQRSLEGPELAKVLEALGKAGTQDADEALKRDLGDMSMSNWRRGRPFDLKSDFKVNGDKVDVLPKGPAKGPWRVLEDGRQANTAGSRRSAGFSKAGKAKTRKVKRTSGATAAKNTWSEASALMDQRTPKRVQEEHVKVLRVFGG